MPSEDLKHTADKFTRTSTSDLRHAVTLLKAYARCPRSPARSSGQAKGDGQQNGTPRVGCPDGLRQPGRDYGSEGWGSESL
jgi:hypothetical protein